MRKTSNVKSEQKIPLIEIQILDVDDVAKLIKKSKDHVYRLTSQKKIPHYKRGTLYFKLHEILDWIDKGAA